MLLDEEERRGQDSYVFPFQGPNGQSFYYLLLLSFFPVDSQSFAFTSRTIFPLEVLSVFILSISFCSLFFTPVATVFFFF